MKASNKKPKRTELILTPLIDCVLFLMSFLLLVTEFSRGNEFPDIKLPDIRQAKPIDNAEPGRLVIMIKQSGEYYIGGAKVSDAELRPIIELEARLSRERGTPLSNRLILVGADLHTPWQFIQKIIMYCSDRDIRISRLAFATQPGQPGEPGVPPKP